MAERKKRSKWVGTAVVGLMVVAMGGFGLSGVVTGGQSDAAITVGKTKISIDDFNRSYQAAMNQESQRQGRQISLADARLLQLDEQVTRRELQFASLSEAARVSGLEISDKRIAEEIASIEAFQDDNGKVDPAKFTSFLKANNLTEDAFVSDLRVDLEREMVMRTISNLAPSHNVVLAELNKKYGEKRSASFIAFNFETAQLVVTDASEDEIAAYYTEHKQDFLAPAERVVDIAYVMPSGATISDEELRKFYDENIANYSTPALVTKYQMLSFPTLEEAQAVTDLAGLKAMASDRGLAEEDYVFTDEPLSAFPDDVSMAIAKDGADFYGPIQGPLGFSVYAIEEFKDATTESFETVKSDIAKTIATLAIQSRINEEQNIILDLAAGGVSPEDIAKETSLEYTLFNTTQAPIAGLTDDPKFIDEINKLAVGETSDLFSLENGGVAVVLIKEAADAMPFPLDAVREQVVEAVQAQKKIEALNSFQAELLLALTKGTAIADVAKENGLTAQTTPALNQQEAVTQMPIPIAIELYGKEIGDQWGIGEDTERFVVTYDKVEAFDETDPANIEFIEANRAQIDSQFNASLLDGYTRSVLNEKSATTNPKLIEAVVGTDVE